MPAIVRSGLGRVSKPTTIHNLESRGRQRVVARQIGDARLNEG